MLRFLLLMLVPAAVAADDMPPFDQCLDQFREMAREQALSERVVDQVVPNLRFQPRVIELDRRQPEFTQTFGQYLDNRVTLRRVLQGRLLYREYRDFLAQLTDQFGIPGHYLLAFWGLETNFGGYIGRMPTLDSLATLACDRRRDAYFTRELLIALSLLDRESLAADDMKGSWAGAVGHTQFMPSTYQRYAIDGDGDGRVDLWRSERDALASAANFLNALGWRSGERWGREVSLPDGFHYADTGLEHRLPLQEWRARGVRRADGEPLPKTDTQAAALVPSGHTGPAFLVYPNFDVIMNWNRSRWYALSVGILADRIAGAGGLQNPPPDHAALTPATIETMQRRLAELGFDPGPADGILGGQTRVALQGFQSDRGLVADGFPDPQTLTALGVEIERRSR